jgi:hypothetical protein
LGDPERLAADANSPWCLHGWDTSAGRAINVVTQRCPTRIHTSASWQVAQSAENDATAVSLRDSELLAVKQTDAVIDEAAPGDLTGGRNGGRSIEWHLDFAKSLAGSDIDEEASLA